MSQSKVFVLTFGCQMNKADSARIAGLLAAEGFDIAASAAEADAILVNTCAVRQHAEDHALAVLRNLAGGRSCSGRKVLGLVGCVAEERGQDLFQIMPELSLVVGPQRIREIPGLLRQALSQRASVLSVGAGEGPEPYVPRLSAGVSEMVKVVEGCSNFCAYCVVPAVRGPERSRASSEVFEEVQDLVARGTREVILLGQNVLAYGTDLGRLPGEALTELLRSLSGIEALCRIRLVTCHPKDLRKDFIDALPSIPKFCPQFQLPFQSGSNRVLQRMGRRYTREGYLEKVAMLREVFHDLGLFVDIIVGFPEESAQDFEETLSMLEAVRPDRAFVFKYSPRPHTEAFAMQDDVSASEKQRRLSEVDDLEMRIARENHERLIGSLQEVLIEGQSKKNREKLTGRTLEGRICVFDGRGASPGDRVQVHIDSATAVCLHGTVDTSSPCRGLPSGGPS